MLRIPPTLVVAFGIRIWFLLFRIAFGLGWYDSLWSPRFILASDGVALAGYALTFAGLRELASRLTDPDARAVRLSLAGIGIGLVFLIGNAASNFDPSVWQHAWLRELNNYGWFGANLLTVLPVAIALMKRHTALAMTAIVLVLALAPPVFQLVELAGRRTDIIDAILRIAALGALFALLLRFEPGEPSSSNEEVGAGLRMTARGVWLYAASLVLVVAALLLYAFNESIELIRLSSIGAVVLRIAGPAVVSIGLLRAARMAIPKLSRYLLCAGAAGALWVAGGTLGQLAYVYGFVYQSDNSFARDYADAFRAVDAIVMIASFGVVALAVRARATHVQGHMVGGLIAFGVALGLDRSILQTDDAVASFAMSAGSAIAAVVGAALVARMLSRTAASIEGEPGIPAATVVSDRT